MLRRSKLVSLSWAAILCVALMTGCGGVKNETPQANDGQQAVSAQEAQSEKSSVYVAKKGDNLRKIAARPDIYGDADLWPLISQANAEVLGQGVGVKPGTKLIIPRDKSDDEKAAAREQARQASAAAKSKPAAKAAAPTAAKATAANKPAAAAANVLAAAANKPGQKMAKGPEANAVPTAEEVVQTPPPAPIKPVATRSSGMTPVLLVILLILLLAALVLLYFMRKDKQE